MKGAWLAAVVGLVTLGGTGCGSCGAPSEGTADAATAAEPVEPPVPAPAGLIAEAWVREPHAAWGKIQRGVSGAVALLPPAVGELACAFAGLDAPLAQLVDGKGTSYVVLGDGGAAEAVAWVAALPVTDAARASSMLFADGADGGAAAGRYSARDVGGMRLLSGGARPLNVTAALARGTRPHGWLVLASSEEALARLGPNAVRTLPTKTAPAETAAVVADVPPAALAGPVSAWLGARWAQTRAWLASSDDEQRAKHGGRAPDFGDPRPIVDALDGMVTRRLALLAGARGAHVVVDAGEDEVHVELAVTPGSDEAGASPLATMTPGDTAPLAPAPADAALTLLVRDDPASRAEDAAAFEATLAKALGDRLHDDDSRAIHAATSEWVHARGDWWTAALAWGPADPSRGVWLRTPAASADASSRAVRELVDLSHRRPLADMLAGALHLSPASVRAADAPPVAKASLAVFADATPNRKRPRRGSARDRLGRARGRPPPRRGHGGPAAPVGGGRAPATPR